MGRKGRASHGERKGRQREGGCRGQATGQQATTLGVVQVEGGVVVHRPRYPVWLAKARAWRFPPLPDCIFVRCRRLRAG